MKGILYTAGLILVFMGGAGYAGGYEAAIAALSARDARTGVAQLRRHLQAHPEDHRARRLLVVIMRGAGAHRVAKPHLRHLIAFDKGRARTALYVQAYQEAVASDPVYFKAHFALLPSSNVYRRAEDGQFHFGALGAVRVGGRAKTGMGMRYGLSMGAEKILDSGLRIFSMSRFTQDHYGDALLRKRHYLMQLGISGFADPVPWGLTYSKLGMMDTVSVGQASSMFHSEKIRTDVTLKQTLSGSRSMSFTLEKRSYPERRGLDFKAISVNARQEWKLGKGRSRALDIHVSRNKARFGYHGYMGGGVVFSETFVPRPGERFQGYIEANLRAYSEPYPLQNVTRRDVQFAVGFNYHIGRVRWKTMTPVVGCSASRNRSNIALYTMKSIDCMLRVEKTF
ncbi:MAG: hypothetical protein ACPGVK_02035 [Halocynthiibacter sp.]